MSSIKRQNGFTIVELLIVIVVIAILATISIVAYNGVQQRARDSIRKDNLAKIVKAFKLWSVETGGDFTTMSAGSGGAEAGWFNEPYSPYPSVSSVLVGAGFLNDSIKDPIDRRSPADEAFAYMIASCSGLSSQKYRIILARLENPPSATVNEQLGTACSGGSFDNYTTTYHMNYGQIIEVN